MSSTTYTPTIQTGTPLVKGFGQLLISVFAALGHRLMLWQARASDRVQNVSAKN